MKKSVFKGIEDYIQLRRSFGFSYEQGAVNLRSLSSFLKRQRKKFINTRTVLDWLESHPQASSMQQSTRLSHANAFALYWKAFESKTEIPDRDICNHPPRRARPYIYSALECKKILKGCFQMSIPTGVPSKLYARAYYALYGLIMTTGLRRWEAVNLRREHIDLQKATLFVEITKFRKSRMIPLDFTTVLQLQAYAKIRDKLVAHPKTDHFFLSSPTRAISDDMIYYRFVRICHEAGIKPSVQGKGPRLHDLRHTFAVRVIQRWLREGKNIHELMPLLSTYMGHDHPSDTYWYLTGIPEILKYGLHKDQR